MPNAKRSSPHSDQSLSLSRGTCGASVHLRTKFVKHLRRYSETPSFNYLQVSTSMLWCKRREVTENGRKLHTYEIYNLNTLLDIISTLQLGTQFCIDAPFLTQFCNSNHLLDIISTLKLGTQFCLDAPFLTQFCNSNHLLDIISTFKLGTRFFSMHPYWRNSIIFF